MATCHPEKPHQAKGLCNACYQKATFKPRIPKDARESRLKCLYGLLPGDYERMAEEQEQACYLCKTIPKKLFVDHDHLTGKVRRLLCHRCNFTLGFFEKTPELFEKFKEYLNE